MELSQAVCTLAVIFSCLFVVSVVCEEDQQAGSQLELSQPQKRSSPALPQEAAYPYPLVYADDDDQSMDKRSSLFRFGKRGGSLFRFGKRGSLFRFGKRGSLFRFGKRGSLFRFGKREDGEGEYEPMYPEDIYISGDDDKRQVKSFHWGREAEEQ